MKTKKLTTKNYKNEKVVASDCYDHIVNISKRFNSTNIKYFTDGGETHVHAQMCHDKLHITVWKDKSVTTDVRVLNFNKNADGEQENEVVMDTSVRDKATAEKKDAIVRIVEEALRETTSYEERGCIINAGLRALENC